MNYIATKLLKWLWQETSNNKNSNIHQHEEDYPLVEPQQQEGYSQQKTALDLFQVQVEVHWKPNLRWCPTVVCWNYYNTGY